MNRVLVLDGEQRSALAVTRSLGKSGCVVDVCSSSPQCLAGASRYARQVLQLPSVSESPKAYAEAVARIFQSGRYDMLIPVTDMSISALMIFATHLPLLTPERADYERLVNKANLLEECSTVGIATPQSERFVNLEGLIQARDRILFPCILKPARSIELYGERLVKRHVKLIASAEELDDWIRDSDGFPVDGILLQECLSGSGAGVFVLAWEGQVKVWFAHRRLREKPPGGGVSVLSESIAVPHHLKKPIATIIRTRRWSGVAMFEFKANEDGELCIIEVNGRFWGSLQLAIDAGVDFPVLLAACAQSKSLHLPQSFKTGVRERWWLGDLDHLYLRLTQRSVRHSSLPPLWLAFLQFIFPKGSPNNEIRRRDDMAPFWFELRLYLRNLL